MAGILDLLEFIFAKPLCLLLLTSVVFLNLHCSFGEKNSFDRKNWNNEQVKCGRVISSCAEGGNELFISYKYNQPVDKWERCSWIVAIPNATSFTIEPILNGLKTPATGLVALGINDEDDLVSYNLEEGISRNLTVKANYMHIIFWSNNLTGSRAYPIINGFLLRVYVEMGFPTYTLLPQSTLQLFSGDVNSFIHPSSNFTHNDDYFPSLKRNHSQSTNKELSVITFHPTSDYLSSTRQGTFLYRKIQTVTDNYCKQQTLKIYSFRVSPDGLAFWEFRYRYCEDVKVNELGVSDVVLVVIDSIRQDKDSLRTIELGYVFDEKRAID